MGRMGQKRTSEKASTLHWLFDVEAEWLKISSDVVLLAGWCPPARATRCLVPPPAPEVGEDQLPGVTATPAQPACGLQESHTQPT